MFNFKIVYYIYTYTLFDKIFKNILNVRKLLRVILWFIEYVYKIDDKLVL